MCPFRYLYHVLLFLLSNALLSTCAEWKAFFNPSALTIKTASKQRVQLVLSGLTSEAIANINDQNYVKIKSENDQLATVRDEEIRFYEIGPNNGSYDAFFDINGVFLGESLRATIYPRKSYFYFILRSNEDFR